MMPLRLLIVADDPLVRAGLTMLLEEFPECIVIGQVSSTMLASNDYADAIQDPPDAIIWDWGWETAVPTSDWLDGETPVVALLADDLHAAEAWHGGIRALLRRDIEAGKLLDAARSAVQGLIILDPDLAQPLLPLLDLGETKLTEDLTPRETEVLKLLAQGLTNRAIAQQLSISDHTVKFHVNGILSKFGAQSRTEAVVLATRMGLISL